MRPFICLLLITTSFLCNGQELVWMTDHPGIFISARPCPVNNFRANAIYGILNRIPFLTAPKGFDVSENIAVSLNGKVYEGNLLIGLPKYYRYNNGPIEKEGEFCHLRISINAQERLMNQHSVLFSQETDKLHMPPIFTDTFPVSYQEIKGYPVGLAVTTQANSNIRLYVLNPRHRAVFLPVTREQYLRLWIGKLGLEIEEGNAHDAEMTESLKTIAANPALSGSMGELEKVQLAARRWNTFLREKKAYYQKKLAALSPAEKKAPAYYSLPKQVAVMQDSKGNYLENISGHLPYEPDEGADAVEVKPLFTFHPAFFDPSLPPTAFQLIVFIDCYSDKDQDTLKSFLDENFYPHIDFKDIAALMYK